MKMQTKNYDVFVILMTLIGLISRLSCTRCSNDEYLGDDDDVRKKSHTVLAVQLLDLHMKTHTYTTDKLISCMT